MRKNLPVNDTETLIPTGVFIYSRTDTKGRITEANEAFASISGFSPAEMIGEPHNLIRHPDMPPEAFADMWATLKAGRPWKGIVKNRRKDGGFYWVEANASPVRENGQVVGYQSVRSRPDKKQAAAAAKAYARILQGDKSIRIENGRVVRNHSPLVETLLSFQARLSAFVALACLSALLGTLDAFIDAPWFASIHHAVAALALLVALYMFCLRLPRIYGDLRGIRDFLDNVLTSGNLLNTMNPRRNDLIGGIAARLDTLNASMRATLQIIGDATRDVAQSTDTLHQGVVSLVQSASQQSSNTSAAAAGVEEMTVSIGEVAAHAAETQQVTQQVGGKAQDSATLSDKATETIRALAATVAHSAETVEQLGDRTEEVSKVAGVIKEIADQTNLLALNAAIEAARAGEQGRGFAVVADEVRKLAERTGVATQEIEQMISRIQGDTVSAVEGMRKSAAHVGESVTLVHEAREAMQAINEQMTETLQRVSDISHSSAEQSSAMRMMAQSVEQVSRLTDENLEVARATESSAEVLETSVGRMRKAVAQYQV